MGKYMSNRFNLPPGVTVNMIEGDPEGYFMISEELLLMGDHQLIQLQSAPGGDFVGSEHTIDLVPREARVLATAILKILNGQLGTDGREVGDPEETHRLVFGVDIAQEGDKAAYIILNRFEGSTDMLPVAKPPAPFSREVFEKMEKLKQAILQIDSPDSQIIWDLYRNLAEEMKIHHPARINSEAPPARVFIYPDEFRGLETGFMGEDEPDQPPAA